MNTQEKEKEIIEEAVSPEMLANYLCADWGERLGIYADGKYLIGQDVGREIAEDERPIVWVECPGIGNISTSYYTDGWVEDLGDGYYRVLETNEEITETECIHRACLDGEVSDEMDGLKEELLRVHGEI